MKDKIMSSSEELSLYKNIIESFFKVNYPQLEPEKFWPWFLKMLVGKEYDINNLTCEQSEEVLNKLKVMGDLLFEPQNFNGLDQV